MGSLKYVVLTAWVRFYEDPVSRAIVKGSMKLKSMGEIHKTRLEKIILDFMF